LLLDRDYTSYYSTTNDDAYHYNAYDNDRISVAGVDAALIVPGTATATKPRWT
jgi:hypothetical protein